MKRNTLFNLLMALGLMLALGGGIVMAHRAQAQGPGLEGQSSIQAAVGAAFTYQGRLLDSDTPVDGACDFEFSLWDAASGGSQAGSTQTKTNVDVDDGYFSAPLDFGGSAFQGDARYLRIAVRCPAGSGSYTTLSGRVALTAAPYAHSLRPGAKVASTGTALQLTTSATSGSALRVIASASSGNAAAVYGESFSSSGAGLSGSGSSGYGVYGGSSSGTGVYGKATASSGINYGVYGKTNSPAGWAVYADGRAYVNGELESDGNFHALSNVEVDGDVTVHSNLTWGAHTSYLAIPAAALQPNDESIVWDISSQGDYFYSATNTYYVAPVFLPHNATVTEIKTWWKDGSASDATLYLRRVDPGTWASMATLGTSGSAGTMLVSSETTINQPVIDNSQYSYILYVELPDSNIDYYQTVIKYTTTAPH